MRALATMKFIVRRKSFRLQTNEGSTGTHPLPMGLLPCHYPTNELLLYYSFPIVNLTAGHLAISFSNLLDSLFVLEDLKLLGCVLIFH